MYLLLDSSGRNLSVAFATRQEVVASTDIEAWQKQSELMIEEIAKLAASIHFNLTSLQGVVVGSGPGSYTGVRISVTIAKVLTFALRIPLYSASSLAFFATSKGPTICVSDARSNRSYVGVFDANKTLLTPEVMTNEELLMFINNNKQYKIAGELKHLNIESAVYNRFSNMLSYIDEQFIVADIKKFKPTYLKD